MVRGHKAPRWGQAVSECTGHSELWQGCQECELERLRKEVWALQRKTVKSAQLEAVTKERDEARAALRLAKDWVPCIDQLKDPTGGGRCIVETPMDLCKACQAIVAIEKTLVGT